MGIRAWYITWMGAVIVVVLAWAVAISVVPETGPAQSTTRSFDLKRTVAPMRGGLIERSLRPVPPIHDALWPRLPTVLPAYV